MVLKEVTKKHKNVLILAGLLIAIIFAIHFFNTYSEDVSDSSWDGVVATSFSGGTGSIENPFIISSAGELAYFESLLNGEDASVYLNKNYTITSSINYGDYNFKINNTEPFGGTIKGNGHKIYNINITDGIFNEIDGANFYDLNLDINYTQTSDIGYILGNTVNDTDIIMFIVSGDIEVDEDKSFGGLLYNSSNNVLSNIILDYNIKSKSENISKFVNSSNDDDISNILVKEDNYPISVNNSDIKVSSYKKTNNANLDSFNNDLYEVSVVKDEFIIEEVTKNEEIVEEPVKKEEVTKEPTVKEKSGRKSVRGLSGVTQITEHNSGLDGTTLYVNDFVSDRNYLIGLNYAEVRSTSLPSGVSTGYYDDEYLVKVQIIYDGKDINNSSLVGAVSPINNENTNKFVYYKYYPLERTSNGTLAVDANNDNYIKIELIDNPFSKRPYVTQNNTTTEYGFNGWVCNQGEDTTAGLCDVSRFIFDYDDYTRYLQIPVDGESEIVVHLNASWYKADVRTSTSDIGNFKTMQMQPTNYSITETVTRAASYFWDDDYARMEYTGEYYVRSDGRLPGGKWYKTSLTSGNTYTYISTSMWSNPRCPNKQTCYIYDANTTYITEGTKYDGGTYTFIGSFHNTANNTETTISAVNTNYMELRFDPEGQYTLTSQVQRQKSYIPIGGDTSGFFYQVSNPTSQMINTGKYYNNNGELCTSTSGCSTAYKLIHYDDETLKSNGNSVSLMEQDSDGNAIDAAKYYYLVTRDMNIFRYTSTSGISYSNLNQSKPFTITGTALGGTTAAGRINITSNQLNVGNDLVIENIRIDGPNYDLTVTGRNGYDNKGLGSDGTSGAIYANSKNLKIGRNVTSYDGTNYMVVQGIYGGANGSSGSGKFRVIVESGYYYAYHSGRMNGGSTNYSFNETTIFGSDFDRVQNSNQKLRFLIGLDGYAGGNNTAGNSSLFASYNIVRSGSFGYNYDGTPNTDNTSGLYIGARSSTYMNSLTGAKIEGGLINTVVGGYGYNGSNTTNSTFIGMSGGTVRSIYGGAGHSTTKGNRIVCVTGGTVSYSVLGGSDSYDSGETNDGIVQGSTLVYVGGNVTVGGGSGELYGVESGSVFGAGGGDRTSDQKGTVYNSHVIINGGTINTAVYGGGNHGSTGTQSTTASTTKIEILAGTIGSVYGGSKSAGFSKSDYKTNSLIDIDISGGTIGNVYGGSSREGTINGTIDISVTGGNITNIYGGGRGGEEPATPTEPATTGTFTTNNVTVTIGDSNGGPNISGNVYGGSAFGSVNDTSLGNVQVIVNDGNIVGSVFGGGEGDSSHDPVVNGNITVTINGGDIGSVFGGNDQAGSYTKQDEVHLNGGTVENVYGGGNRSSVRNTHVYLSGSTVTNIYGGSNTLGNVSTTTISVASGTVQNVYGGNNLGGTCGTTTINVTGTASVNGSIYGGGNQVATTTTNVILNSCTGTIPNVYGGGNAASVTTANVTNNGVTVTNMFGGSNSSGTVTNSYVTNNSGTVTNIYGGNNAGGNTVTSHVDFVNGNATTIYGGGNQANGGTSNVIIRNGTVGTVFGGGNSAGLTSSDVHVISGSITDIYGGSNNSGVVSSTNILIDNTSNTVTGVYGGGNRAQAGSTSVEITAGTFTNVYGGGNLAQVNGNTVVDINGGTINGNIYGGGNFGVVTGSSTVTLTGPTILGSAYAGGNGSTAIVQGNTSITVDDGTTVGTNSSVAPHAGCVFGGGNQAETGVSGSSITSTVNIVGGTFYGNIYGGANTSLIYGSTSVNIGDSAYSNGLTKSNIYIKGHVFGGGEANASGSEIYDWNYISVNEGTNIVVDGTGYNNLTIGGSFYGGGNASSASGVSYLLIKNYGTSNNPKRNVSIQRVDYVTIDHSSILLKGAVARANDYATELFSISRVQDLKLKNNSELYLVTGANLLEKFESVDSSNNYATVTINKNTNTVTKSVDNRVYMYEGKNLNVAKDQQVTDYGDVKGMTFLGIFNYDNDNNVNTGIYNSTYNAGDLLPWSGTFSRGSYVLGKHLTNHDITVDGFYTNNINEETTVNEVDYVTPTPESGDFYMWLVGENVIEYNVNLVASKYSTLGSEELSFLEFNKPNTSFQILSLDSSEIASGISLVDRNSIPRVADTTQEANSVFGLSMESSNNGWLTFGKTSFYTREPSIGGTTYYEGENSTVVPTMLFYLYHSKNITETQDLGTVRISVMAITKVNALSNEIKRLVINVNMSTRMFNTIEYEGAMTPGDKYELFAATRTNITTKSKFSAYYGIFAADTNLYRTGYTHVLTSTYVLPVGTKITMIDFGGSQPEYYYHVIDANDYARALAEYNSYNEDPEASYPLSMFTKMGSKSNNSNYNDATQNSIYYDGTNSIEEFIFIVDFGDTNITQNQLNNKLLIELRDNNNETILSVLGIQHSQLTYSLYANSDAEINVNITPSDNPLYIGYSDIFDMVIGYESTSLNGVTITDTQYFDSKLGVQVYIKNNQNNVLSGTDLTGTYFQVDGVRYYPDINGYTHIKLADKVGNTEKWLIFNTDNSTLASGSYTFVIETFASPDGIYYSKGDTNNKNVPITIISSVYGLNPIIDDNSVIFSANNDKNLAFTINYTSLLDNPNIRIAMYRRKYDNIYDTNYELVDLQDYVDQQLFGTNNTNEYLLVNDPLATNDFVLLMEDELLTGTYRLAFRLYDNDTMIGEIIRYIIIK